MGYLREVFFRPDASPYQTLGLAPDVPQDAVKERFRLLMLLVHPDRQGAGPAWPDRCASQANQAYAILRDPGSRAAYDRQEREKAAAAQAAQQAAVAKAAALKSRPSRGPARAAGPGGRPSRRCCPSG
ncbi:MAG: DnaJ domain-containing protein [Betaproteobacteria bacterium]|nr:DnaJ domain-containing protein [Betaproteobacteria bacterium]